MTTPSPGPDVTRLAPADAIVALRSYPRRFRAAVATVDDERPDDVPHRAGPDGWSAADHVDHAGRDLALLGESMRKVLVQETPVLHPAVLDDDARQYDRPDTESIESSLDLLELEANDLADAASRVDTASWTRAGRIADRDESVTGLDLLREGVRAGAQHLQGAERAMRAARGGAS